MPTNEIMAYLSLGCIMSGLDGLFSSLYGVSLHTVEVEPGEAWHYDVHKLVNTLCCSSLQPLSKATVTS